jgi:Protein of unknown function (DUF3592)
MISGIPAKWIDPRNWPWMFYVWLALVGIGQLKPLWRWIQRNRARSWLTASGQIDYVSAGGTKRTFFSASPRGSARTYEAELGYSYSIAGTNYAGRYKRDFGAEEDAYEFVRDLKGKSVPVQYNPDKPSSSAILEASVEALLQNRAPKPAEELSTTAMQDAVPGWVRPLLWPFIGLSAIGLVVSLWVHLGAVTGRRVAPEAYFWILHMGIFVVWFPAVLVAKGRVGNINRKDYWKVVLRGCPDWMRYMVYGFFAYAVVNFALFMLQAPAGGSRNLTAVEWRGFSGHWMAFYSAALAILYSSAKAGENARHCLNGHPIPPNANFCTRCGQPVTPS